MTDSTYGLLLQIKAPDPEQTFREVVDSLGFRRTFTETGWVDWLLLLAAIAGGVMAGRVAQGLLRRAAQRAADRNWWSQGVGFRSAAHPANLALITLGLSLGLRPIVMSQPVRHVANHVVEFLFVVALGWFLFNLVDLLTLLLRRWTKRTSSTLDDHVVPLASKTLRLFLVVVFALFTAENIFGADITAWLAGLGIAGLAVSLAAQDSIKNLFGSLTVLLDRPFGVGDSIHFGGHEGPVEAIGFRSTKMRTFDGDLVTVPNAKIVDDSVRNMSRKPYIRRVMNLGIAPDTPPEKMEEAVRIVKDVLAAPDLAAAFDLEKHPPRVAFDTMAAEAFNIKIFYWHYPGEYWDFLAHSQDVNLRILRGLAGAGIELAYPSRVLYLADDPRRGLSVRVQPEKGLDGGSDGNAVGADPHGNNGDGRVQG